MMQIYLGIFAIALCWWGCTSIISPKTIEKFTLRLSGVAKWTTPIPDTTKSKLFQSQRFTGVLAFATGVYLLQLVLRSPHHMQVVAIQPQPPSPPPANRNWLDLIFDAGMAVVGLQLFLRPQILRGMIEINFPRHKLSTEMPSSTATAGRLFGTVIMLMQIYFVYLWFKSKH